MIYTTNALEGFNRQVRKYTKSRTIFPTDEFLNKCVSSNYGNHGKMDSTSSKLGCYASGANIIFYWRIKRWISIKACTFYKIYVYYVTSVR